MARNRVRGRRFGQQSQEGHCKKGYTWDGTKCVLSLQPTGCTCEGDSSVCTEMIGNCEGQSVSDYVCESMCTGANGDLWDAAAGEYVYCNWNCYGGSSTGGRAKINNDNRRNKMAGRYGRTQRGGRSITSRRPQQGYCTGMFENIWACYDGDCSRGVLCDTLTSPNLCNITDNCQWNVNPRGKVNTNSRFSGRTQSNPKGKPRK